MQTAVNSATNGDTVLVPAGNCTWEATKAWSGAVEIPSGKQITLQGQGIGKTVIIFIITKTESGYNSTLESNGNGVRITGFTFLKSQLDITGRDWRIDHNRFEGNTPCTHNLVGISAKNANYSELVKGLIDNNQFHNIKILAVGGPSMITNWAWARPLDLGTAEAVYVEDNEFFSDCSSGLILDANYGGSYVFRYNRLQDANIMAHAVQGANRATRKWEVYNNFWFTTPESANAYSFGFIRAGTGVVFNNTAVGRQGWGPGLWHFPTIIIDEQRSCRDDVQVSGKCDGTSPWDGNTPGMSGYPCRDQIGRSTDNPQWVSTVGSEGAYTQQLDPAYAWNNFMYPTEADKINKTNGVAFGFDVKDACPAETAHLLAGRDFYNNAVKPGYTPYTYPHPLRASVSADATPPAPPTGLSVN